MKFTNEVENQRKFAKNFIDEMSKAKDVREAGLLAGKAKKALDLIIEEFESLV